MAKLKLHFKGDPILAQKAKPVTDIHSKEFQDFLDDLIEACIEYDGVGIAAPQVGKSLRVFIMVSRPASQDPDAPEIEAEIVINPLIIKQSEETAADWEGCLSVPGFRGLVVRSQEIEVQYQNRKGETVHRILIGYFARIFLHEYDHLEGILYLDRMEKDAPLITLEEYEKMFPKEDDGS
jgi:peptide deformylase